MPLTDTDVSSGTQRAETALEALARGQAQLLRSDGSRLYADDEHEAREAALIAAFDAAVAPIREQGFAAAREADAAIERLNGDYDPLDALTGDDLTRANARAPFVKEDIEMLPPHQLERRLAAVLADGDRVMLALFERYLGQILNRWAAAGIHSQARIRIGEVQRTMRERLGDSKLPEKKATARAQLDRARRLQRATGDVHARAHRTVEREMATLRASGRYSL